MKIILQDTDGTQTIEVPGDCQQSGDSAELDRKISFAVEACKGIGVSRTVQVLRKVIRGHNEHGEAIQDIPAGEIQDEMADKFGYHMRYRDAGIEFADPDLVEYRLLSKRLWDCVDRLEARMRKAHD